MITGQQRHNQDLAESIRVQENGLSITYGNLALTLDSHRQQLIGISDYVSVAEQEYESLNKDLYYIGEQYQTLIEEMDENLYEIGINDLERGHLEQDLSSSVMLESRLALEYEQVVKRYNELEQQMAHEQQLLDRVQGQYHHERILADQDDAEYNQLLKATKELQDRLDAERIDYETRVKADTTYSYDISRQIEELVNQRQEWDIKVDLAIASLRQAHDEIGQIQAVSKAVIGRDKEQEKLCHDIAIEYGNIQSALPPVLAKLRSLENNLATARIAYQSRILNIEMAIADGQSEHDQVRG
uniref:Uncharacterized protein n=1 Tax=Spongospora subterranea TaxID=70186 RepID=A0A0H5QJ98_9EUKA|eukprot:CRZ02185.1 hypothetical protein [Spongospora subterranea]